MIDRSGSPAEVGHVDPDVLRIKGGKPLVGTVRVRGAKNTLPKDLVAALLTDEPCTLRNVSDIQDVDIVCDMLRELGCEVSRGEDATVRVRAAKPGRVARESLQRYTGRSRIPILLCGPLLARTG